MTGLFLEVCSWTSFYVNRQKCPPGKEANADLNACTQGYVLTGRHGLPHKGHYTGHIIEGHCVNWKPCSVAMHPGYNAILTATCFDVKELAGPVLLGVVDEKG